MRAMRLWKDNKIEEEWALSVEEICERFAASKWCTPDYLNAWPLQRRLLAFIGGPEQSGGLNSAHDEAEFDDLFDVVLRWERVHDGVGNDDGSEGA